MADSIQSSSPLVVLDLDKELLSQCLVEILQLARALQRQPQEHVRQLGAQVSLRAAYHLIHSSETSCDSQLRDLALHASQLAQQLLLSRQSRDNLLHSHSP